MAAVGEISLAADTFGCLGEDTSTRGWREHPDNPFVPAPRPMPHIKVCPLGRHLFDVRIIFAEIMPNPQRGLVG
jgi:hypothetical protein